MAYTKVGPFVNDSAPFLNAANMNTIETGIYDAHTLIAAQSAASGVDYQLDETGTSSRTIDSKLNEWKSLLDFGADPTGVADSTAAIAAWLEAGGNLFAPDGTYLIAEDGADSGGVDVYVDKSTLVQCGGNAVFKAQADLDNDMIRIRASSTGYTSSRVLNFTWIGGTFDQTEQKNSTVVPFDTVHIPPNVGASATAEALSFYGEIDVGGTPTAGFSTVTVRDVTFNASTTGHWESAGGDCGLFIGGAVHKHVTNCVGIGSRDLAIYCSGLSAGVIPGGSTYIVGNKFFGCMFGASSKRESTNVQMLDNIGYNTAVVCIDTDATGPGANVRIAGNIGYGSWRTVRATQSAGVVIENNHSYMHGHLDESGTAFAATFQAGNACVSLEGVTKGIVRNNSIQDMQAGATYNAACVLSRADDGTNTTDCNIYGNTSESVYYGILEELGEASGNIYKGNFRRNMDANEDIINPESLDLDSPLKEVIQNSATASAWVTATAYTKNDLVSNGRLIYQADADGTSGGTAPTHESGSASDGGVSWTFLYAINPHTGTTSATTICTATVPADTLTRHNRLHITASGSTSGTNDTKTIGIKIGSQAVQNATALASAYESNWLLNGYIDFITTTTGQRLLFTLVGEDVSSTVIDSFNEDFDAGAIDVKLQFTLANASDSITLETFSVRVE